MSTKPASASDATALHLEQFLPYRLNILGAFASRALVRIYATHFGIGIPEWRVIAQLGEFGSLTSRAIGEMSQMHKTKVSRAVMELDQRGLVARSANRADRRESFISLTPAGSRMYGQIVPLALAFQARWTEGIAPDELRVFERVLAVLMERGRHLAGPSTEDSA